jgi:hypothetical protein
MDKREFANEIVGFISVGGLQKRNAVFLGVDGDE